MTRRPCKNCERLAVDNDKLGTRIAELEARLALLTDPHAVHVNIMRGDLPLTKAQAIHIAGLPADVEARLAALDWTPISEENLPKPGDEVWGRRQNEYRFYKIGKSLRNRVYEVEEEITADDLPDLFADGWTHFRPINPHNPPSDTSQERG